MFRRNHGCGCGCGCLSSLLLAAVMFVCLSGAAWRCVPSGLFRLRALSEADTSLGWNLVLVNAEHALPEDYEIELTQLSNGECVDSRIYPALQQMFDDARAAGVYPLVNEGYRTRSDQQDILDDKIAAYMSEGAPRAAAESFAADWVAQPGTSEHELGLAVDVNADKTRCDNETVYAWLAENAWHYGFIQRYPADKEDITGISCEPWHYRYVGTEAAKAMTEQNLCLEEYVEMLS